MLLELVLLELSTTTATIGVQVLLESSVARVLLSARVPMIAWPRRARVRLVLVAFEQSSNRRVLFFGAIVFDTYSCSCARVLPEQYAA